MLILISENNILNERYVFRNLQLHNFVSQIIFNMGVVERIAFGQIIFLKYIEEGRLKILFISFEIRMEFISSLI